MQDSMLTAQHTEGTQQTLSPLPSCVVNDLPSLYLFQIFLLSEQLCI